MKHQPVYVSFGGENSDKPRLLTLEEREKIKQNFPLVRAADKFTANFLREQILQKLDIELQTYPICPSQIKEFVHRLYLHHLKSLIEPGTPVGIIAATSIGSKNTQSTLDSFHFSWKAASKSGLKIFDRLVDVSKTGSFGSTIYFKNKHLSAEEALMSKVWLESATIDKLLFKKEILPFEKYYNEDYRWWYDIHPLINYKNMPVLRLFFDLDLIYQHKFSLQDIITSFRNKINIKGNIHHDYFIGPNNDGIVDIYINFLDNLKETMALLVQKSNKKPEEQIIGNLYLTDATAIEYYYTLVLYPEMEKNVLKGISGIDSVFVETVPILSVIKKEFMQDNEFFWQLDDLKMKRYGINFNHLKLLANEVNINLTETFKSLTGSSLIKVEKDAKKKIITAIDDAQKSYENELEKQTIFAISEGRDLNAEKLQKLINKYAAVPRSKYPILQKAEYSYVQTAGSNLIKVLAHPLVDNSLTTCDNFHEISEVLGIVACKKEYLKKMQEIITGGLESNSHPAHILLYANFVMSRGVPLGSTYSNVSRHPLGFLAEATIERAAAVFKTAAGFGAYESANSVSTSVSLAERIKVGTGAFDIIYQVKNGDNYLLRYNENVFTAHKDDADMIKLKASKLEKRSEELEGDVIIPDIEDVRKIPALHNYEVAHPNAEILSKKESGLLEKEVSIHRLPVAEIPPFLDLEKQNILGYLIKPQELKFGEVSPDVLKLAEFKKKQLNDAKNLLNNLNKQNIINAYDPFYNKKLGFPHVTNAWFKYWEILHLLKTSLSSLSSVKAFFNAELPGSALMAFIRFCKQEKLRYNYRASSYLGENTLEDKFNLVKNNPSGWLMVDNRLYDGDMMNINNILYLENLEKFNFYSSDASRGLPKDDRGQLIYSQEEIYNAKLHLGCALAGFAVLQPGGIFVSKIFTFFEPFSWNIILVYSMLFETFSIFKPQASRTSNSEIYLIGINYKPNNDIYNWLKEQLSNFSMKSFLSNDLSAFYESLTIFDRTVERLNLIANTKEEDVPIITEQTTEIFNEWLKKYPITFKGML